MARLSKDQRARLQDMAEALYINTDKTQQEISLAVGVSEKTITAWKDELQWESKRAAITITAAQELKRLFMQVNELNTAIMARPEGQRYANSKEADALKKITAAIKDLQTDLGISETVSVCQNMLKWMRSEDYEASVLFGQLSDKYVKSLFK